MNLIRIIRMAASSNRYQPLHHERNQLNYTMFIRSVDSIAFNNDFVVTIGVTMSRRSKFNTQFGIQWRMKRVCLQFKASLHSKEASSFICDCTPHGKQPADNGHDPKVTQYTFNNDTIEVEWHHYMVFQKGAITTQH
eukprot:939754_1